MDTQKKIKLRDMRPKNINRKVIRDRNLSFIQMLGNDWSRDEIAAHFGLSKRTVDSAIDNLRLEYDCNTVHGLVYRLFKLGLIK